ncbi:MAG: hemolysin family protein [Anaerolineaceae bacterium]|jgi:putative hemolysin|nr:hemolysin family protein [Anaerolineaceae bacterium]
MNVLINILLVLGLILANGLFAMYEMAMVSSSKVRLKQRQGADQKAIDAAVELSETPNRLLSTVQVGITLVGVFSGAVGGVTLSGDLAPLLARLPFLDAGAAQAIALLLVTLTITYFSLVIGELIPKRLALSNPEKIAITYARFFRAVSRLTSPIIRLLSASTDLGLRILGAKETNEPPVTEEEIRMLLQQGTEFGIIEEEEQSIMESVFRFGDRRVDAIMTPHTEITWLDVEEEFSESLQKIMDSRYTRFPVAKGGLDNVIGVLLTKDLLQNTLHDQEIDLEPMLRPAVFIPESMPAMKVLEKFKETGLSVALVIDEYGGMLGMVTQADVLKSIVGDIPSAGEDYDRSSVMRSDGSWLLDGLMRVDELKPMLNIESLPDEERVGYQTLGGFIMSQFDTIPVTGQTLDWSNWRFEVVDMDGRRIDKVLVAPLQSEDKTDETGLETGEHS